MDQKNGQQVVPYKCCLLKLVYVCTLLIWEEIVQIIFCENIIYTFHTLSIIIMTNYKYNIITNQQHNFKRSKQINYHLFCLVM